MPDFFDPHPLIRSLFLHREYFPHAFGLVSRNHQVLDRPTVARAALREDAIRSESARDGICGGLPGLREGFELVVPLLHLRISSRRLAIVELEFELTLSSSVATLLVSIVKLMGNTMGICTPRRYHDEFFTGIRPIDSQGMFFVTPYPIAPWTDFEIMPDVPCFRARGCT